MFLTVPNYVTELRPAFLKQSDCSNSACTCIDNVLGILVTDSANRQHRNPHRTGDLAQRIKADWRLARRFENRTKNDECSRVPTVRRPPTSPTRLARRPRDKTSRLLQPSLSEARLQVTLDTSQQTGPDVFTRMNRYQYHTLAAFDA